MDKGSEEFRLGPWHFSTISSHILASTCKCSKVHDGTTCCDRCLFIRDLQLPSLPDMVFAKNVLTIRNASSDISGQLCFRAVDALKRVSLHSSGVKVFATKQWAKNRLLTEVSDSQVKPFDWTFTTDYCGTLQGFKEIATEETIDYEELKLVQPILFYKSVDLFEDELSDHGCSQLQVKLRCMPNSFLALLQFYLRVDMVLVRIFNTRFFWKDAYGPTILKERSVVEKSYEEMSAEQREAAMRPMNFTEVTRPTTVTTYRLQLEDQ